MSSKLPIVILDSGFTLLLSCPVMSSFPRHVSSQCLVDKRTSKANVQTKLDKMDGSNCRKEGKHDYLHRVPEPPVCSVGSVVHPLMAWYSAVACGPVYGQLAVVGPATPKSSHKVPIPRTCLSKQSQVMTISVQFANDKRCG